MAVIVLDNRVPAIVIAVVSLRIPRSLVSADMIKLDCRIVATPRPKSSSSFRHGQYIRAITHNVIFDKRAVTTNGHNAITGNFFNKVATYHSMFTWIPIPAVVITAPNHGITCTSQDMAILDDKAVEARLHQFSFIDNVNSASSSQLLDV